MRERIEALFQDVLTPLFEADGGSIELIDVKERVVVVRLGGQYRGCPSGPYTVAGVVVPALKKVLGQELKVEIAP